MLCGVGKFLVPLPPVASLFSRPGEVKQHPAPGVQGDLGCLCGFMGIMMDLPLLLGGNMPQVKSPLMIFHKPPTQGSACCQGGHLARVWGGIQHIVHNCCGICETYK